MLNTFTPESPRTLHTLGPAPKADPQAWKTMIGAKPVPARLAVLPDAKSRWSSMLTSVAFQIVAAAVVVALPLFFPSELKTSFLYQVTPLAPLKTEVELPAPQKPQPVRRVAALEPKPAPVPTPQPVQPRLTRNTVFAPMLPKAKPVEMKRTEMPQVDQSFAEVKLDERSEPVRPREPVKTGMLTTGSAAPATIEKHMDLDQVQTGGFGDERGLPGENNPRRPATIARLGSPALPSGLGYGNGTGGANGVRGTVASTGFGNGVAIQPSASPRGNVQAGGFATAKVDTEQPRAKTVESAAAVQPVVILEKPSPVYTAEARKLGIEGEVLIQVVFPASGPVRVIRVTKGLGHGLDEAAIRAAQQIRFKPALQESRPVDFPATVHIVFQLAF
jgi:TonB family protein